MNHLVAATSRCGTVFTQQQRTTRLQEHIMATTRRPQINHKACSHAATPKARKACRKAYHEDLANEQALATAAGFDVNTVGVAHSATPAANCFKTATLRHELAYLADGTPVPACSRKVTKGEAMHWEALGRLGVSCNRCSGAHR